MSRASSTILLVLILFLPLGAFASGSKFKSQGEVNFENLTFEIYKETGLYLGGFYLEGKQPDGGATFRSSAKGLDEDKDLELEVDLYNEGDLTQDQRAKIQQVLSSHNHKAPRHSDIPKAPEPTEDEKKKAKEDAWQKELEEKSKNFESLKSDFFSNVFTKSIYTENIEISSFDVAESYVADYELNFGDVVAVNPQTGKLLRAGDPSVASFPQDDRMRGVLGVISQDPAIVLREFVKQTDPNNPKLDKLNFLEYPVALVGRVLVNITNEGGSILPGDYLTVSPTKPGYATKATKKGRTIGIALDPYDPSSRNVGQRLQTLPQSAGATEGPKGPSLQGERGPDQILMFVSLGYYDPLGETDQSLNISIKDSNGKLVRLDDKIREIEFRLSSLELRVSSLEAGTVLKITNSGTAELVISSDVRITGTLALGKGVIQEYNITQNSKLKTQIQNLNVKSGLAVYLSGEGIVDAASSQSEATAPAIGLLLEVNGDKVKVVKYGSYNGFSNLQIGKRYYLAKEPGKLTTDPKGSIIQVVGIAETPTTLSVQPNLDFRINTDSTGTDGIEEIALISNAPQSQNAEILNPKSETNSSDSNPTPSNTSSPQEQTQTTNTETQNTGNNTTTTTDNTTQ